MGRSVREPLPAEVDEVRARIERWRQQRKCLGPMPEMLWTETGARTGDAFMSLIHTAELNGAQPFEYMVDLLRHAEEVEKDPARWMPWNRGRPGQ